jgi:hypothetical protein
MTVCTYALCAAETWRYATRKAVYVTVRQGRSLDFTLRTAVGFLFLHALSGTARQGVKRGRQRSPTDRCLWRPNREGRSTLEASIR